jgi:hypothetical protein
MKVFYLLKALAGNMPAMLIRTALLSLLVLAVGCASSTRTYDLTIRNNSSKPLTLVGAKDGTPKEPIWTTPEDLMAGTNSTNPSFGLGVVPPGKIASVNNMTGTFAPGANAYLRIYAGDLSLGEVLKIGPGDPNRIDITLTPGQNVFVVKDQGDSGIELDMPGAVILTTQPSTEPTTEPSTEPTTAPMSGPEVK